jgi:hypothetical protein
MKGNSFRRVGHGRLAIAAGERRHDTNCFADEVVVDFPSVALALDRIHAAFLADERLVPLSAAITLTPSEARTGARVPLDVPVRCTCRDCGGRGGTWHDGCPRCTGSGVELLQHQIQVSVPAGVNDGERFHFTLTPRHDPPTRIELLISVR